MQRRHTVRFQDLDNPIKDQAHSHCRHEESDNPGSRIDSHWPQFLCQFIRVSQTEKSYTHRRNNGSRYGDERPNLRRRLPDF